MLQYLYATHSDPKEIQKKANIYYNHLAKQISILFIYRI